MTMKVYRNRPFFSNLDNLFSNYEDLFASDNENDYSKFPVNIYENKESSFLEAELPGFTKNEIKINLEKNILTISAEKNNSNQKESDFNYILIERNQRKLKRAFEIPENLKIENIKAKFENGLLILELPKKEEEKRNISINIE